MKETIVFIIKKMRKYRDVFFKISFCLLLTQAVTLVGPYISGLIVDNFLSGAINIKYISYLIVAGVGLGLFAKLIDIVRERLDVGSFHFDFHQETWMDGFEKMLTLSVGQHANKSSGVKDKIMSKGTNAMRTIIQSIIYDFLPFILKIATTLVALFIIDWHFGLLALGGVFIAGGIQTYILYRYLPDLRHLEILGQQTHKSSWDILRNIYLVKNSGREQHAKEYVDETLVEEYSLSKKNLETISYTTYIVGKSHSNFHRTYYVFGCS
jgi:ABC-type multidrug transport system fused ATPase/permease subunit